MAQRTVLVFATVAALSAGTNYAFSAWAPELAERLHLSSKATNFVGLMGNAGVYGSGPFLGLLVDYRGPRLVLIISAASLFFGYIVLHALYDGGETGPYSTFGLAGLAFGQVLTGIGSSGGLSAAVNGVSKSFSPLNRGMALATVVAGFGLSAFFYSTLSHFLRTFDTDATSSFLLLLAFGCGLSMLLGATFVKPVLVNEDSRSRNGYSAVETGQDHEDEAYLASDTTRPESPSIDTTLERSSRSVDLPPRAYSPVIDQHHERSSSKERDLISNNLDINGRAFLMDRDFHVMFAFLGLCAGIGLMYLNNLGTIIVTLAFGTNLTPAEVSKAQAHLVSLLSICNCLGRLAVGWAGDHFANHSPIEWRFPRIRWYIAVATGFLVSQVVAAFASSVNDLFLPTAIVGFSYGSLFSVSPVVCLERFGLPSFGTNNGILTLSPSVFGNIANVLFGIVYDSHVFVEEDSSHNSGRTIPVRAKSHLCTMGKQCFATAFKTTIVMSLCALLAAVVLASRRSMHCHR
ncbi:hypothetical protein OIO90_000760 [Microbotryomycetes sp. JL221]|nr:hypothetical protein OIO90_000760 [Microbotryomycetes sp. JL221]